MPDGSNLDAHQIDTSDPSAHAVEFSKTAAPSREGGSFADDAPERDPLGAGLMSIAPIPRTRPRPRRKPNRTRKDSAPTGERKRPRANRSPRGAIASGPHAQTAELALADLQHRAVQAVGLEVERVGRQRLAGELEPAPRQPPA